MARRRRNLSRNAKIAIGSAVGITAIVSGIVWWRRSRPKFLVLVPTAFPQKPTGPIPPPPKPFDPTLPPPPQPVPVPQGPSLPPGYGQ